MGSTRTFLHDREVEASPQSVASAAGASGPVERAELGRDIDHDIKLWYRDIMARTVVDLRDDLIARARRLTGMRRKVEIVNAALETFIDQHEAYRGLLALRGKVRFRASSSVLLRERHGSHR